jgi:RNA polymerase sigma-70 factor (ECF subfamily)
MQAAIATNIIQVARRERVISELDDIETLVRSHRARLLRFVMFSIGDEDVAASIVQDAFLKAYNNRESFRGDCTVQTWLTTIALNLVRDHQRTQKFQFWKRVRNTAAEITEVASIIPSGASSPETQLLARERAAQVAEIVQGLSFMQRTVFLLRFQEEVEISEIARMLDMPANTVKTHLYRAVRAVRQQLGGRP